MSGMGELPKQDGEIGMPATTAEGRRAGRQQMDAIAASLRRAYSDAVAEDVPDALMDLLKKLR